MVTSCKIQVDGAPLHRQAGRRPAPKITGAKFPNAAADLRTAGTAVGNAEKAMATIKVKDGKIPQTDLATVTAQGDAAGQALLTVRKNLRVATLDEIASGAKNVQPPLPATLRYGKNKIGDKDFMAQYDVQVKAHEAAMSALTVDDDWMTNRTLYQQQQQNVFDTAEETVKTAMVTELKARITEAGTRLQRISGGFKKAQGLVKAAETAAEAAEAKPTDPALKAALATALSTLMADPYVKKNLVGRILVGRPEVQFKKENRAEPGRHPADRAGQVDRRGRSRTGRHHLAPAADQAGRRQGLPADVQGQDSRMRPTTARKARTTGRRTSRSLQDVHRPRRASTAPSARRGNRPRTPSRPRPRRSSPTLPPRRILSIRSPSRSPPNRTARGSHGRAPEDFTKAMGRPDPPAPSGLHFTGADIDDRWANVGDEKIGAGFFANRFLYLFGEGLEPLNACLEAWSFLVPRNDDRLLVGRNAYGAIAYLDNANGAKPRLYIVDPLRVALVSEPDLDLWRFIARFLPLNLLPAFTDDQLYREWLNTSQLGLSLDLALAIKVPLSLGGEMELDNFSVEGIVDYYQTTAPVYAKGLAEIQKKKPKKK